VILGHRILSCYCRLTLILAELAARLADSQAVQVPAELARAMARDEPGRDWRAVAADPVQEFPSATPAA